MTLFIGPTQGGLDPAKSKVSVSPAFSTARAMVSGRSTTPSESTKAFARQVPSGMAAMWARIWSAARVRSSAIAEVTVSSP